MSKTYNHRGNHRHKSKTKKHWFIYYYDEEGNFRTEKVNWFQAMFYKAQKRKRIKMICTECGNLFLGLVMSVKDKVECPKCSCEY